MPLTQKFPKGGSFGGKIAEREGVSRTYVRQSERHAKKMKFSQIKENEVFYLEKNAVGCDVFAFCNMGENTN